MGLTKSPAHSDLKLVSNIDRIDSKNIKDDFDTERFSKGVMLRKRKISRTPGVVLMANTVAGSPRRTSPRPVNER